MARKIAGTTISSAQPSIWLHSGITGDTIYIATASSSTPSVPSAPTIRRETS